MNDVTVKKKFFLTTVTSFTFKDKSCKLIINTLLKGDEIIMKKLKTLLIITLCLTFTITTTNLDSIHEIAPLEHLDRDWINK